MFNSFLPFFGFVSRWKRVTRNIFSKEISALKFFLELILKLLGLTQRKTILEALVRQKALFNTVSYNPKLITDTTESIKF